MKNFLEIKDNWLFLWGIVSRDCKKHWVFSQIIVLVASLFEFAGIGVVIPFFQVLTSPEIIQKNSLLSRIHITLNISQESFILTLGLATIIFVLLASLVAYIGNLTASRQTAKVGIEISVKLFSSFLDRDYRYHLSNSSSALVSKISHVNGVGSGFLNPISQIFAKSVLLFCIIATLLWVQPILTIAGAFLMGVFYCFIYYIVSPKVKHHGERYFHANASRLRVMHESFRGIKDILTSGTQDFYKNDFAQFTKGMWDSVSWKSQIALFPKHLLEATAFASLLTYALFDFIYGGNIKHSIAAVGFFAVLGYKLLPSIHAIYSNLVVVIGTLPSLNAVKDDLTFVPEKKVNDTSLRFSFKKVSLDNVSFSYDGKACIINDVSINIKRGEKIAIVGPSGAGKSTIVDILLGLLQPDSGRVTVDDVNVSKDVVGAWRRNISYVPQNIFIADTSFEQNIYFGNTSHKSEELKRAIWIACLNDLYGRMRSEASVGENGITFSGGQRQRIGIARAIYRNADLLILDEATSALDPAIEAQLWERLSQIDSSIIFITHKMNLAKKCDRVYFIKEGKIEDEGKFTELYSKSESFKEFVKFAEEKLTH